MAGFLSRIKMMLTAKELKVIEMMMFILIVLFWNLY